VGSGVTDEASTLDAEESADWSLQAPADTIFEEEEEEFTPEPQPVEQGMGAGRWPTRERAPPQRLSFSTKALTDAPRSIREAMGRPEWLPFEEAISSEMCAMTSKQVYDTVTHNDVPPGQRVVQSRMLLNIKRDADGRVVKYIGVFSCVVCNGS
jgi:hypothetical protein